MDAADDGDDDDDDEEEEGEDEDENEADDPLPAGNLLSGGGSGGDQGGIEPGPARGGVKVSGFPMVLVPAYSLLKQEQLQLAQLAFVTKEPRKPQKPHKSVLDIPWISLLVAPQAAGELWYREMVRQQYLVSGGWGMRIYSIFLGPKPPKPPKFDGQNCVS